MKRGPTEGQRQSALNARRQRVRSCLKPCFTKAEAKRNRMKKLAKELVDIADPGTAPVSFALVFVPKTLKLARMVLRG